MKKGDDKFEKLLLLPLLLSILIMKISDIIFKGDGMKAEKFEIKKDKYIKYYTGRIIANEGDRVTILTTRGEALRFWKSQILGSTITDIEINSQAEEDEKDNTHI